MRELGSPSSLNFSNFRSCWFLATIVLQISSNRGLPFYWLGIDLYLKRTPCMSWICLVNSSKWMATTPFAMLDFGGRVPCLGKPSLRSIPIIYSLPKFLNHSQIVARISMAKTLKFKCQIPAKTLGFLVHKNKALKKEVCKLKRWVTNL